MDVIELTGCPRQNSRVLAQGIAGTRVLLSLDTGEYYSMGDVADRIWHLCDGTNTVADIISTICQEYDAPSEVVEADVVGLLTDLAQEKLVISPERLPT